LHAAGFDAPKAGNGMATASLVLGIVGVFMCFVIVPSILAVIFGGIGVSRANRNPAVGGRGRAIAGLLLGIVSLALLVLLLAIGDSDVTYGS
jgi:hypothetical protein